MKFRTETGSLYELDLDGQQVRRLIGKENPTPRQGADGEWKSFVQATEPTVGHSVIFIWQTVVEGESMVLKSTMTSKVVEVGSTPS